MAKRIKQTINVSELFNAALVTPQQQAEIIRSQLWPIIVAAYSRLEGNLMVHRIGPENATYRSLVHLTDKAGITVAAVWKAADNFNFMTADSPFATHEVGSGQHYSTQIYSKNASYIATKLRKGEHDAAGRLSSAAKAMRRSLSNIIRGAVDQTVDKLANQSLVNPSLQLDNEMSVYATKIALGECTVHDVPRSVYDRLMAKYQVYKKESNKVVTAVNKAKECFSTSKYVYMPNYNGGVLLAEISPQPMIVALEKYANGAGLPDHDFCFADIILPFQWYPSINHIPDDVRNNLEASLLMFKAHTNMDKVADGTDRHQRDETFPDINAYVWGHYNYNNVLILER